jgi:alcohol dehydrogenase/propanol-preferring alcohol dehydrogenase
MKTMRVAQISKPGMDFELVEREVPQPGPGEVRIKVEACGICHSDSFTKDGTWPGVQFPRVPGHEIAGVIDAAGPEAGAWEPGRRVGVGWYGGHCTRCDSCRRGDFIDCNQARMPGISYDGGYARYVVAPTQALAAVPDELSAEEAAPLLCAGITTFNALRRSGAKGGDLVAVLGIGGLGHLGVQFASKLGFQTVALGRGADNAALALKLGATSYVDTSKVDPAQELARMGGASVILVTAPDSKAMSGLIEGLAARGKLLVVAASPAPMEVVPIQLLSGRSIAGWPSGTASDSEDTLRFAARTGVRPMIEVFPLASVSEAYERMLTGKVRFRAVLKMGD